MAFPHRLRRDDAEVLLNLNRASRSSSGGACARLQCLREYLHARQARRA